MIFYVLYNFDFFNNMFLVIYNKLLLLNMEIIFNIGFNYIHDLLINLNFQIKYFNIMNNNIIFLDEQFFFDSDNSINNNEFKINENWYESVDWIDLIINFFYSVYAWVFMPLLLCIILVYILHSIGGLYSAYVDYYQKNPDHFNSSRGFIPAFFIFFLFLFTFFSIIFFILIQYLKYFLWFLFI